MQLKTIGQKEESLLKDGNKTKKLGEEAMTHLKEKEQ